jgi:ubiquitin-activating enzyme E1 C
MLAHPQLGPMLAHPTVSYGTTNLYMRGVLEAETRPNLARPLSELLSQEDASPVLTVNDKKLSAPLRVRLRTGRAMEN